MFLKIPFKMLISIIALLTITSCTEETSIVNVNPDTNCIEARMYMGLSNVDGEITETAWNAFVDTCIIKHFPQGFTIENTEGAWKECDTCETYREKSKVVIVIFADSLKSQSVAKINTISDSYKSGYKQQAVLITYDYVDCFFR